MRIYLSSFVLPVASPVLPDGAVAVDGGRIVAVGPREAILASAEDDAEVRDLGRAALLPGLINAHTHVELSWLARDPPPGGHYMDWLAGLLERRAGEDPDRARRDAERSIEFMVSRGTVAVGDVGNRTWPAPLLARSELEGIFFHEVYGFAESEAAGRFASAVSGLDAIARDPDVRSAKGRWRFVATAHAPHTTSAPLLGALARRATEKDEPLSVHVAESDEECSLLRDGSGQFPMLYRKRGGWSDAWTAPGKSPVDYLDRHGGLTPRTLAVHCVHIDQADRSKLQRRGSTVVACVRSNRHLGVGRAPVPELLGHGIPVALGTDSLASAPDLDLFAEMEAMLGEYPRLTPAAVLRMATLNGAAALGLAERLGSIEPGKLARCVVIPMAATDENPIDAVCSRPDEVWPLDRAPWRESS